LDTHHLKANFQEQVLAEIYMIFNSVSKKIVAKFVGIWKPNRIG
jgi:hypothetical protein